MVDFPLDFMTVFTQFVCLFFFFGYIKDCTEYFYRWLLRAFAIIKLYEITNDICTHKLFKIWYNEKVLKNSCKVLNNVRDVDYFNSE